MKLSWLDVVIVLVYLVGVFALAQWVSREKAGHKKDAKDYFLASKTLPWWAIGTSTIAANISAEQIIGMSGSGYASGLAIASYEWMAALTLLIVAKWFLPIFLRNNIYTMPQFLEERFGKRIRTVMAVFWLVLYVFVNLTSILWLGSLAIARVTGMDQFTALVVLGTFALAYQMFGGLKAVAMTDPLQVTLLVLGGFALTALTLSAVALGTVGQGGGILAGFHKLWAEHPEHFQMILKPDNPEYKNLPGLGVLFGGLWIMNLSYWGFNQYIIQRSLAAANIGEAQKGLLLTAFLKLLIPVIVVLPGIAAVVLAPNLAAKDWAYPTMLHLLPPGALGLVFAALVAAIVSSLASKINSIATIFTLDFYAKRANTPDQGDLVKVGRIASVVAVVIGIAMAKPLVGSFDQAFQYIQQFTGFFTPGITVIFLLGLFWKPANENGALAATIGGFVLSMVYFFLFPQVPFLNSVGYVFLMSLALGIVVSKWMPTQTAQEKDLIRTDDVNYTTSASFNIGALVVIAIVAALYTIFW
jgi:SSS family solute:Na+ symporter